MEPRMITQISNPRYKNVLFKLEAKKTIAIMCTILGYKNDDEVDETILGFLAHVPPFSKEIPKWNILVFLYQSLNQQLIEYPTLEDFRYASCLLFLFLYQNFKCFESLGLRMNDEALNLEILVY